MIDAIRFYAYAATVGLFVLAGICDLLQRDWRTGVVAFLFAAANACIFLWR